MTQFQRYALLIGLILLGFGLRLYQIDAVAFRGDEAYTMQNWAMRPFLDTLQSETITADPQAPLSYFIYRQWYNIFGFNLFSMRVLSVFVNVVGIASMFALGKLLTRRLWVGIIAALLFAVHPFEIWHAQDARNYAIWAGLSVTTLALGVRAVQQHSPRHWLFYLVGASLVGYIYYLEIFVTAAFDFYALIVLGAAHWIQRSKATRNHLAWWFGIQVALGVILGLWYLRPEIRSGGGYTGTVSGFELHELLTWFVPSLTFGQTIPHSLLMSVVIVMVVVVGLGLLWRVRWRSALLLTLLLVLPMIALSIVSTQLSVFTPRYILGTVPAYLIAIAVVIVWFSRWRLGYVLSFGLLGGYLVLAAISLDNHYHDIDYAKSPEWDTLAMYLRDHATDDDLVIQLGGDASFGMYFEQFDVPSNEGALPVSAEQHPDEIIATLDTIRDQYESIWVVGRTIPSWTGAGVVETWMQDNMQLIESRLIGGKLPAYWYRDWQVRDSELQAAITTDVVFEGVAALSAYEIIEQPSQVIVLIYWQPIAQSDENLTAFVHLVGDRMNPATGTPLWSQDDHPPMNGIVGTSNWNTDRVYRDVFVLPLDDVDAGDYQLQVGLYNPNTGERAITNENADAANIGTITLR